MIHYIFCCKSICYIVSGCFFFQFIYGRPDLTESLAVHVLVLCRIVHTQHELCQIELLKKMNNDDDILIDMYM